MKKEQNLNKSSYNVFERNKLDIDNSYKEKNNDSHSNISEKWALKVNFNIDSKSEENNNKNKISNINNNKEENKQINLEISSKNKIVDMKKVEINNEEEKEKINAYNEEFEEKKDLKIDKIDDEIFDKKSEENNIEINKGDKNKEEEEKKLDEGEEKNEEGKEEKIEEINLMEKDKNENSKENFIKIQSNKESGILNKEMVKEKSNEVSNNIIIKSNEEIIKIKKNEKTDMDLNVKSKNKIKSKDSLEENKNKNEIININNENKQNLKNEKINKENDELKIKEIKLLENISISEEKNIEDNSSNKKFGKRRKRKRVSTRLFEKKLNLDEIGKIKIAEKHAEANRILKQINKFNNNTQFCPCCCLPCPQEGILEPYSYCDNTDDFSQLGQGTSLYFSFFKYSIIIIAATSLIIGIPFLIFSYNYTYSMQKLCNNYYLIHGKQNLLKKCELYVTLEEYSLDYYSVVDSPFFLFSSTNIKDYRKIYYQITNINEENNKFENSLLSFPLLSLICSITLFIINILFTIIIYNKNISYDYNITSPSDFTVFITNMNEALWHYLNIRKKYEEMIEKEPHKLNDDGTPFDFTKKLNEELCLKESIINKYKKNKNKNKKRSKDNIHKNEKKLMSRLKQFSAFIESNICTSTNQEDYNIKQLNICFKLNEFMQLEDELQEINTKITKTNNHPYQIERNKIYIEKGEEPRYFGSILSGFNLFWFNCCDNGIKKSELEKQKEEKEKKIQELMKKSEEIDENNFAGVAFVSFNTIKEQEDFLSQFPDNIFTYFLKIIWDLKYIFCFCCNKRDLKSILSAYSASEPEDVIYENMEYSSKNKTLRMIIVYIISIFLIGICLGIFIALNILQDYVNEKAIHYILSYIISLCNTCVSSILNIIFQMILDFLTKMEKQYTMTEYYRSYSVKLTLFSFFTSSVVPLICELINKSDGFEILISNMLMMFLVNAFVTPIMWTMNFTYFLKKFRICLINLKKDPNNEDKNHNMTQRELNDLYELPDMSISYKYSYLAKTILMTFLYIPIFPLGIVISFLGFILGFFLEKFNYSRMYKRPEMLNHRLCVFYVNHFDVVFFVYAIGDYVFMHDAYKNEIIPLVKIIIFGVLTIIPYSKFLKRDFIGIKESDINQKKYEDLISSFSTDYERSNPLTRKKGIKKHLKNLLNSKRIKEDQYNELLSNTDSINHMQIYYESRNNKYLFDVQRNFAKAAGKVFLNMQKENENKKIYDNRIYIKEENVRFSNDNEINNVGENSVKEENNIADIYNNPHFVDYGCTIQSYVRQMIEKEKIKEDNNEENYMNQIEENKEEEEKDDRLLIDKINKE